MQKACRVASSVLLGALLVHATIWVVSADTSGPLPSAIERAEKHVNELSKILVDLKSASTSLIGRARVSLRVYVQSPALYSYSYSLYL